MKLVRVMVLTPILAFVLLLVACGGSDNGSSADSTPTQNAAADETASGTSNDEATQPSSAGDSQVGSKTATVTIGDQTYEFNMLSCIAVGGAVGGTGRATDGSDVSTEINLPPKDWETSSEDWDPPYIRVDDGVNEVDWRAGGDTAQLYPSIDESQTSVDSYANNGSVSQGSATFAETNSALPVGQKFEVVSGSFAINCG